MLPARDPLIGFSARLERSYVDAMNRIAERDGLTKSDFLRAAIRYFSKGDSK